MTYFSHGFILHINVQLSSWPSCTIEVHAKCYEVVSTHWSEGIPFCSELLSLHCPRELLFLALLPACGGAQLMIRQEFSAYAKDPLQAEGLLEAAHQYSPKAITRSVNTPSQQIPLSRDYSSKNHLLLESRSIITYYNNNNNNKTMRQRAFAKHSRFSRPD